MSASGAVQRIIAIVPPVPRGRLTAFLSAGQTGLRLVAVLEAVAVFAACQALVWRPAYRHLWLLLLAWLLFSAWLRNESPQDLGIGWKGARASLPWAAAGVAAAGIPILAWGALHGRVGILLPDGLALLQFAGYAWWCVMQQFALQSFMHQRLLDAVNRPHFTSIVIGVMFGSLHLPNPVLTIATLFGGWAMGEVFARNRNIWVLALAQAIVSTCIVVALPDSMHHRLRVGPGYFFWHL